jgi:glutamate racemase
MKIGIFDSGMGGLTVLREVLRTLPMAHYLFYADTDHVPYGNKTRAEVRERAFAALDFLAGQGCRAALVACNTATSAAIDELRASFPFPIVGMEPAVKPAVLASDDRRVLVLATEMTLREPKFRDLVARVDREGIVDYLALQELVGFAERYEFAPGPILDYLRGRFLGLELEAYGTVVLGCTHFPYFRPFLRQLMPAGTALIDGNAGTAQRLASQVAGLEQDSADPAGVSFYRSGRPAQADAFRRYLDLLEAQEASSPAHGMDGRQVLGHGVPAVPSVLAHP